MKKYELVMNWVLENINSGSILPEQKLPSESQLMERFNVSRNAVRHAITELIKMGAVESQHGVGTFCVQKSKDSSMVVGVICLRLSSYIFPKIIEGCNNIVSSEGYNILLKESRYDIEEELRILKSLHQSGVDGIIITPVQYNEDSTNAKLIKDLEKQGIPIILLDNELPNNYFCSVVLDDFGAGRKAAKYLWERGHRDIGILYSLNYRPKKLRMEGAIQFINEQGAYVREESLIGIEGYLSPSLTYKQIRNFLKSKHKLPTAMVCSSDDEAIMFMHQARQLGIHVPGDVSIISFDNSDIAQYSHPRLTSLNHPSRYMGELAARLLFQRIQNGDSLVHHRTVVQSNVFEGKTVKVLN